MVPNPIRHAAIVLVAVVALLAGLVPRPAAAAIDTWRVLHVRVAADFDGNGAIDPWAGNKWNLFYDDAWCMESTVETLSSWRINVETNHATIASSTFLAGQGGRPIYLSDFQAAGLDKAYGFRNYDVVSVWTGGTTEPGYDGMALNWVATYGYNHIRDVTGVCPTPGNVPYPSLVPAHEFLHNVFGLYQHFQGKPYGTPYGTYDYDYHAYGEWEGHRRLFSGVWEPPLTWAGVEGRGITDVMLASGSWRDHFKGKGNRR